MAYYMDEYDVFYTPYQGTRASMVSRINETVYLNDFLDGEEEVRNPWFADTLWGMDYYVTQYGCIGNVSCEREEVALTFYRLEDAYRAVELFKKLGCKEYPRTNCDKCTGRYQTVHK